MIKKLYEFINQDQPDIEVGQLFAQNKKNIVFVYKIKTVGETCDVVLIGEIKKGKFKPSTNTVGQIRKDILIHSHRTLTPDEKVIMNESDGLLFESVKDNNFQVGETAYILYKDGWILDPMYNVIKKVEDFNFMFDIKSQFLDMPDPKTLVSRYTNQVAGIDTLKFNSKASHLGKQRSGKENWPLWSPSGGSEWVVYIKFRDKNNNESEEIAKEYLDKYKDLSGFEAKKVFLGLISGGADDYTSI